MRAHGGIGGVTSFEGGRPLGGLASSRALSLPAGARGLPVAGERAVGTPWSFPLLLVFLVLLYSNAAVLVPALAPAAPAQTVALAALAVLFVERSLARQPVRLAWPESHLLLAFLGVAAVSAFTALWMRHAVENTLTLLKFVAVYLLMANTVESWRRLRTVYAVMAIGALFPAVGALVHVARGELVEGSRAAWIGVFANPNDLAYALALVFPLALAVALERRGVVRWLLWGALAAYAAAAFFTYSRSGLLGFGAVVLLCVVRWTRPGLRLPALLLVAAGAAYAVVSYWGRQEGFGELTDDATTRQRIETMRIGLEVFADRPLLGAGLGCSLLAWPLYADPGANAEGWLHSHNTFIQVLSETGLLGTLAFALLIAVALAKANALARRCRRRGRPDLYRAVSALEIALWGFLVCGLAGGYLLSWFPYLLLGLVSALPRIPDPPPGDPREVRAWPRPGGG